MNAHHDIINRIFESLKSLNQWLFLVPVKGGRDYITSQKAIYISGI